MLGHTLDKRDVRGSFAVGARPVANRPASERIFDVELLALRDKLDAERACGRLFLDVGQHGDGPLESLCCMPGANEHGIGPFSGCLRISVIASKLLEIPKKPLKCAGKTFTSTAIHISRCPRTQGVEIGKPPRRFAETYHLLPNAQRRKRGIKGREHPHIGSR